MSCIMIAWPKMETRTMFVCTYILLQSEVLLHDGIAAQLSMQPHYIY